MNNIPTPYFKIPIVVTTAFVVVLILVYCIFVLSNFTEVNYLKTKITTPGIQLNTVRDEGMLLLSINSHVYYWSTIQKRLRQVNTKESTSYFVASLHKNPIGNYERSRDNPPPENSLMDVVKIGAYKIGLSSFGYPIELTFSTDGKAKGMILYRVVN